MMKKILLASALSIFATTAHAAPAPLTFYPSQAWITGQDAKTCSISSTFNNGYSMTLSHSENQADTIALDFKQNAFTKGAQEAFRLGSQSAPAQNITGVAVNATTLEGPIQNPKTTVEALVKDEMADLNIGGNNFRFYLSGLRAGFADYQNCITKLSAPEEMAEAPAPTAPAEPLATPPTASKPAPATALAAPTSIKANASDIPLNPDIKVTIDKPAAMPAQDSLLPMPGAQDNTPPMHKAATATQKPAKPQHDKPTPAELAEAQNPFIKRNIARGQMDFTKNEPKPARPDAEISMLKETIDSLRNENIQLQAELKEEQKISGVPKYLGDWDLEKATLRYQEAERQLKAMGNKLQKERALHEQEKQDLEAMLFNPQVTEQEQIARLAELEGKIASKDMEIKRLQREINALTNKAM